MKCRVTSPIAFGSDGFAPTSGTFDNDSSPCCCAVAIICSVTSNTCWHDLHFTRSLMPGVAEPAGRTYVFPQCAQATFTSDAAYITGPRVDLSRERDAVEGLVDPAAARDDAALGAMGAP